MVRIKWNRKAALHTWCPLWECIAVSEGKGLLDTAKIEQAYLTTYRIINWMVHAPVDVEGK